MKRPTYTIGSCIKKVFRPGERSLPRTEIIMRLEQLSSYLPASKSAEESLNEALQLPDSPVQAGRSEAIVELTYQPHQLVDKAFQFVRRAHSPKNMDQIMRELRKHTNFSWNQITRLLTLDKDPRFVQYEGDERWYLAEWNLANDKIFEYLVKNGKDKLSIRSLFHLVEQEIKLSEKESIFAPELDDRFIVQGENIYVNVASNKHSEQPEKEISTAIAEVASTEAVVEAKQEVKEHQTEQFIHVQEEKIMNSTVSVNKPVLKEVEQLLGQAVSLLDQRNEHMSGEVISHFQESNMDAIETLMNEKHKNEQLVEAIKNIVSSVDAE
ncbi:hypothetical protein [Brevibacillus daliensis]|uniref:hypothetical protein n=1 Tax=Brevibacillus daliensis TaxID=2892995 RepID=UPI001E497BE1|nr:hypothetical protein [Brevibacillus daliensis]